MPLLNKKDKKKLLSNNLKKETEIFPVVKLFNQEKSITWILFKSNQKKPDLVYGVYGKKLNTAKLKSIRISNLESGNLKFKKDSKFKAKHTLNIYIEAAKFIGTLVEEGHILNFVENKIKKLQLI